MIERDDPRLTAYALGEADAETVRVVEAALRDSDGLRQEVDEIRGVADRLARALADEEAPALLPVQRRAIEEQAPASARRPVRVADWIGIAATLVAAVGVVLAIARPSLWRKQAVTPSAFSVAPPSASAPEARPLPCATAGRSRNARCGRCDRHRFRADPRVATLRPPPVAERRSRQPTCFRHVRREESMRGETP